jgi:ankyrin repeat protein
MLQSKRNTNQGLHTAAREGDTDSINRALERGDDVNSLDGTGDTPLHWAVWKKSRHSVRLLMLAGANAKDLDTHGKSTTGRWNGKEKTC